MFSGSSPSKSSRETANSLATAGSMEICIRRERSRCAVGTKMQNGTFCM
ncbi:type IV secretion protein Rhs [Escherichia coli]|nr:type IV secretion protein Rhs [Escherichia coli]